MNCPYKTNCYKHQENECDYDSVFDCELARDKKYLNESRLRAMTTQPIKLPRWVWNDNYGNI